MDNFILGGLRHRKTDLGGRPKSDANYGIKRNFNKPKFDKRGGKEREIQLFQATCTTCGKSCEVPFRPDGTKPVLCRNCFAEKNTSPAQSNNFSGRDRFSKYERPQHKTERPSESTRPQQTNVSNSKDFESILRQITAIDAKLNQMLDYVKSLELKIAATQASTEEIETIEQNTEIPIAKIRKPKKVTKKKEVVKKKAPKTVKKVAKKAKK